MRARPTRSRRRIDAGNSGFGGRAHRRPAPMPRAQSRSSRRSRHLAYGHTCGHRQRVLGRGRSGACVLEFAPAGAKRWQRPELDQGGPRRRLRVRRVARRSPGGSCASAQHPPAATQPPPVRTSQALTPIAPSHSRPVAGRARAARPRQVARRPRRPAVAVRGRLPPRVAGRRVYLEGRSGRRWHELATRPAPAATAAFACTTARRRSGSSQLRVKLHGRPAEHRRRPRRRPA